MRPLVRTLSKFVESVLCTARRLFIVRRFARVAVRHEYRVVYRRAELHGVYDEVADIDEWHIREIGHGEVYPDGPSL